MASVAVFPEAGARTYRLGGADSEVALAPEGSWKRYSVGGADTLIRTVPEGDWTRFSEGGSEALIRAIAEGQGTRIGIGGSEATVQVQGEGQWRTYRLGGSETVVEVSPEGAGWILLQGGSEVQVNLTPEGAFLARHDCELASVLGTLAVLKTDGAWDLFMKRDVFKVNEAETIQAVLAVLKATRYDLFTDLARRVDVRKPLPGRGGDLIAMLIYEQGRRATEVIRDQSGEYGGSQWGDVEWGAGAGTGWQFLPGYGVPFTDLIAKLGKLVPYDKQIPALIEILTRGEEMHILDRIKLAEILKRDEEVWGASTDN